MPKEKNEATALDVERAPSETERLREEREAIVATLPTRSDIYLPTQKIDLESQITGLKTVREIYDDMESVYGPKLRALRDKYKGRDRAFIIGNGPSLNETDLSQLKDEITFCVNGFFLKMPEIDWTPTFYVVEDHLVAEDRAERINAFHGPTKLFPAYLGYCLDRADDTIFYNHRPRVSYPHGFDFSVEADKITYTGCTVTFSCMQLAHYMGFREIYLIGVDASYDIPDDAEESSDYGTGVIDMKSDDTNHFHPDYFGKGYRWHDPQVGMMISAYEEAERITRESGRYIYNATIGGMLEVFERRDYAELFPDAIAPETFRQIDEDASPEDRAATVRALTESLRTTIPDTTQSPFPKVAIIDLTRMGHATATGELKATLLAEYPRARLMQVYTTGRTIAVQSDFMPGADGRQRLDNPHDALDWIVDFNPDVILFRPTPEQPILTELAELAYTHTSARFVTWIMDGWQDRLLRNNPKAGRAADDMLQSWFTRSAECLAISEPMADSYETRYGRRFTPVANAIDPADWPEPQRAERHNRPFVLRYSGGLAPDMSLQTLLNVAEAVDMLAETFPVRFEINTRKHWIREEGGAFDGFAHTELYCEEMEMSEYRRWIAEGDAGLIAYNFDEESQTYVRHSLANKLPECLASGSPLLAVGPAGIATIDYLKSKDLGRIIDQPGTDAIFVELRDLVTSEELCHKLVQEARSFAFSECSVKTMRERLANILRQAARVTPRSCNSYLSRRREFYNQRFEAPKVRFVPFAPKSKPKPEPKPKPAVKTVVEPIAEFSKPSPTFRPLEKQPEALKTIETEPVAKSTLTPSKTANLESSTSSKIQRQPVNRHPVIRRTVRPKPVTLRDVLKFYSGTKAIFALFLIGLAALPALPLTGILGILTRLGPAVAISLLLLLVGRWIVQIIHTFEQFDP